MVGGGRSTCVMFHDQTPWQGDFINPGTLRLLKLMFVALVYCYPVLAHVQID